jgi:hypothetical protein
MYFVAVQVPQIPRDLLRISRICEMFQSMDHSRRQADQIDEVWTIVDVNGGSALSCR